MSVRIRLSRRGRKNQPSFKIVACDSKVSRDGKALEILGYYDPKVDPACVKINADRVNYWINVGAQVSKTASSLLRKQGVIIKSNLIYCNK